MGAGKSTSVTAPPQVSAAEAAAASHQLLSGAKRCDAGTIQKALAAGASPDARSQHTGRPALSFAAQCVDTIDPLRQILSARADVDAVAKDGRTALHIAVAWERGPAASKLVEAGASRNVVDEHGLTPLALAARRNRIDIS
ncbi:unnamed protein product [Polarella glacialis]|uniref:Uncharacterized protein n=1 Tax=Polarella glacialis TaxID=89957 RepID=A0A813FIE0_POLGL|nr:unnamed protein product [Polarella glacialis]CAE8743864.1 unnamed protein product [Polarella glacialis]